MAIRFRSPQLPHPHPAPAFESPAGPDLGEARRKAIAVSNRILTAEEWHALSEDLAPFHDPFWAERNFGFLDQDHEATIYHAITDDHVHIIYCHARNSGLWFLPGSGMGRLQPQDLRVLKQIIESAL